MTNTVDATRVATLELLRWQIAAGVDVFLDDQPRDWLTESGRAHQETAPRSSEGTIARLQTNFATPNTPVASSYGSSTPELYHGDVEIRAKECASKAKTLLDLNQSMRTFDGCILSKTAKSLMFVSGKLDTDVMILGDLPSADDDRTGEAFSGQAGVLLDRMLAAINLKRADFAVTTAIPWRPPGNRAPTTQELAVCLPFFRRQIELVRPRVVLIFGTLPVQMLIGGSASNLKARGHTHRFVLDGVEMDAMVTLSPAHLLKHPAQKKFAWQDLQIFQRMM